MIPPPPSQDDLFTKLFGGLRGVRTAEGVEDQTSEKPTAPGPNLTAVQTIIKSQTRQTAEQAVRSQGPIQAAAMADEADRVLRQQLGGHPTTITEGLEAQGIHAQPLVQPTLLQALLQGVAGFQPAGSPERLAQLQALAGTQPLQAGAREALTMQSREALLKTLATSRGALTDVDKQTQAASTFQHDLFNLVEAWDQLGFFKGGALKGAAGAVGAATIGRVFGQGREARSRFEGISTGLQFTVASYISGQTGRTLSDKDVERLSTLAKFSPSMNPRDFRGRLQAILDFANSKLSAEGITPPFKTAQDLIQFARHLSTPQPSAEPDFPSLAEAEAARLPPGSIIRIQGRRAVVE